MNSPGDYSPVFRLFKSKRKKCERPFQRTAAFIAASFLYVSADAAAAASPFTVVLYNTHQRTSAIQKSNARMNGSWWWCLYLIKWPNVILNKIPINHCVLKEASRRRGYNRQHKQTIISCCESLDREMSS